MRILIVSSCPTHPTIAGNRKFIYDLSELLKLMGHDVYFLYIKSKIIHKNIEFENVISSQSLYWKDNLFIYEQSYFQKFYSLYIKYYRRLFCHGYNKCDDSYPFNLHKMINKLNKKYFFDVCLVNYFYLSKAFKYIEIPKKGLITHDYFAYKSLLVNNKNGKDNINAHEEAIALQRSPHIFSLNTGEGEYFQRLAPKSRIYNIFGCFKYKPSPIVGNHKLLYLSGSNSYNIQGLIWFMDNIFENIVTHFKDVELCIGGAICSHLERYKTHENVNLLGFIDNPDEFYSSADIVINPTYLGTGLKIKTFEAISYDKIVMVHPHSKNGIFSPENSPLFSSDNPKEWITFLEEIWNTDELKIKEIKRKNEVYLNSMNEHILKEYASFFSC